MLLVKKHKKTSLILLVMDSKKNSVLDSEFEVTFFPIIFKYPPYIKSLMYMKILLTLKLILLNFNYSQNIQIPH